MSKKDNEKIKSIFLKIKENNKKGLEELYNNCHKMVYGIAFSLVKNKKNYFYSIAVMHENECYINELKNEKYVVYLFYNIYIFNRKARIYSISTRNRIKRSSIYATNIRQNYKSKKRNNL